MRKEGQAPKGGEGSICTQTDQEFVASAAAAAAEADDADDDDDDDVFKRKCKGKPAKRKVQPGQKRKGITPAPKKRATAVVTDERPPPESEGESDDDGGGGGGGGVAFEANPALRGQAAVDEYFSTGKAQSTRPTEEVLNQFERDPRVARLMMYENTGFDLDNASILLEDARSLKPAVRAAAREELARVVRGVGPDLFKMNFARR